MDAVEQLFLLEVLVDKVVLHELPADTPIRIRVKFIEFPCFEITQQDFKRDEPPDGEGNFNSGKSFLFPMVPLELIRNLQRHPLAVTVFKITEDAPQLPEIVGQTRVRLSEGMSEAVISAMSCRCDAELPISHTLTDTFSLRNMGEEVGTVALFVRLSCFGQSIVTQFQLMGEKKAFLFKNSKADTAFQCKKGKERAEPVEPTKFDVLPVAPFLTSDENTFDMYSPTGDIDDATVAWKAPPVKCTPCPTCDTRPGCMPAPAPVPPPPPSCVCGSMQPPDPRTNTCPRCGQSRRRSGGSAQAQALPPSCVCGSMQPPDPMTNKCPTCGQVRPSPPVRYDTTGALSPAFMGAPDRTSGGLGASPPVRYDTTGALSPAFMGSPDPFSAGNAVNPPVRYDTTGALSPAYMGGSPPPLPMRTSNAGQFKCKFCGTSAPPRSETRKCSLCGTTRSQDQQTQSCSVCGTSCPFFVSRPRQCAVCGMACPSAPTPKPEWRVCDPCPGLSPEPEPEPCTCVEEEEPEPPEDKEPIHPPVRYDTTGALSPAFMGALEAPNPPIRYDTTGALSPAFMGGREGNPPIRYDTTGALSPAFMGWTETTFPRSVPIPPCKPNPPVRYDTTGALSPAFMGWPEEGPGTPSPYCRCGGEGDGGMPGGSFGGGTFQDGGVHQTGSSPAVMQGRTAEGRQEAPSKKKGSVDMAGKGQRRKKRSKFTYKWGLQYPGIKYGHRQCVMSLPHVPPYMGWLWNNPAYGLKYRKGWRPGAVGPTISKILNEHRTKSGRPPIGSSARSKWKSGRAGRRRGEGGPQPPTLHVHRREGAYYISMHPLDLGPDAVNVPLQFKIPKRQRQEGDEDESSSSSEESELEIEFMAPGAFEENLPPPEFKNHATQYYDEDCMPKGKAPSAIQLTGKKSKSKKGKGKGKGKKGK